MARGRASHGGSSGGGAIHACNRAIERKDEYNKSVLEVQTRANLIAETIRMPNGLITELIKAECGEEEADQWLTSCRDRLKAIGSGNAKRVFEIDYFVDGVKEVRAEVQAKQQNNEDEGANEEETPDYERSINEAVDRIRKQREGNDDVDDHEHAIQIRQSLGEKIQKKARASRGGGGDDDDDLEIVQNQVDDVHTLKCPFTGMFFTNPVKNKVCGHTYDLPGLQQMLGARKSTCPIPGCSNKSVSMSQVDEDVEMKLRVSRHKKREEAEKRKRDLEDDEEALE